ncbi:MAG: ABC-type transport auxiliary lipoprotein family protein [Thermodesulfovibrionales bacterium]
MHKIALLLLLVMLMSCNTMQTRIYSINVSQYPQESKAVKIDEGVFLQVKSNRHFKQTYIIYRSSIYEMMQSTYARWDNTPDDILREQITEALTRKGFFKDVKTLRSTVTGGFFRLDVDIRDFSRFDDSNTSYAVLGIKTTLKDPKGKTIYAKEEEFKQRLDDRTYLSLAKGMSIVMTSVLLKMTDEIEEALKVYLKQNP